MVWLKTAVIPLLKHWSHRSLVLCRRYFLQINQASLGIFVVEFLSRLKSATGKPGCWVLKRPLFEDCGRFSRWSVPVTFVPIVTPSMARQSNYMTHKHWTKNVVILTKFSSLAALEVVILTTSSAASDEHFIKMKTFPFQWTTLI